MRFARKDWAARAANEGESFQLRTGQYKRCTRAQKGSMSDGTDRLSFICAPFSENIKGTGVENIPKKNRK